MKFEPISYEHAARLIGRRPWDVSRDPTLLASAQQKAMDQYHTDSCVVGLDIYNLEIEAYGCEILDHGGDGVPVAGDPIFEEVDDLLDVKLDPDRDGRFPLIFEAARMLRQNNPDKKIRLPLAGPFTIASHLMGMEDMICELFTNPEVTGRALMHLAKQQQALVGKAEEEGFAITVFESSVTPPILSPQLFTDCVLPALQCMLRTPDSKSETQLIIGGNTLPIQDAICASGARGIICPVETDQPVFMANMQAHPDLAVRINMNPSVFLPGNRDAALKEADRVLAIAKDLPRVSIGSLIPFDADPDTLHAVARHMETGNQD